MKLGICEWNIPTDGLTRRFSWATEVGLNGMELDLENVQGNESLVRTLTEEKNLNVPTLGIGACCETSMCAPGPQAILEQTFNTAVETAVALGIPKLQVPSFGQSFIRTDADFERTVEHFRFLCKRAEGSNLIVGTENALGAEKQLEMLDRVGSDQFKIYFDTRNAFSMSGLNSPEILEKLYPHICEVHIKDGTDNGPSQPLGTGNSGFFQCMEILRHKNYNGWLLLENDYQNFDQCRTDMQTARNALNS